MNVVLAHDTETVGAGQKLAGAMDEWLSIGKGFGDDDFAIINFDPHHAVVGWCQQEHAARTLTAQVGTEPGTVALLGLSTRLHNPIGPDDEAAIDELSAFLNGGEKPAAIRREDTS